MRRLSDRGDPGGTRYTMRACATCHLARHSGAHHPPMRGGTHQRRAITHVKRGSSAVRTRRGGHARGVTVREYSLVVEGELTDELGMTFAGMTLTRNEGKTLLVGQVRDQAELQGLLQRISNLGLTLLSASTTDADEGGVN
jgi:hypothetical protein